MPTCKNLVDDFPASLESNGPRYTPNPYAPNFRDRIERLQRRLSGIGRDAG